MVLLLIMVVTPLLAMGENAAQIPDSLSPGDSAGEGQKGQAGESGTMKVLRASSNRVETMSDLEYVIGAVSAEMPPTYHTEALKAQAAACYTFARAAATEQLKSQARRAFPAPISTTIAHSTRALSARRRAGKNGATSSTPIIKKSVRPARQSSARRSYTMESQLSLLSMPYAAGRRRARRWFGGRICRISNLCRAQETGFHRTMLPHFLSQRINLAQWPKSWARFLWRMTHPNGLQARKLPRRGRLRPSPSAGKR